MIEREGNELRLADDILHINQADCLAAAVQRNLSVVTQNKELALGNYKAAVLELSKIAMEGGDQHVDAEEA